MPTPPDENPAAVLGHVLSRVGTVFRTSAQRYDGIHVRSGVAVFGGVLDSQLTSVACGRDATSGGVAIRVQVHSRRAATRAVATLPAFVLAGAAAGATVSGPAGAVVGALAGGLAGSAAAYGVFAWSTSRAAPDGRAAATCARLGAALREALAALGLAAEEGPVRIVGLDEGTGTPDPAWEAAISAAREGLAG